jgi:hypothetical protein
MNSILNKCNMNLGRFWDWFGRIQVQNLKDMNFGSWNGFLEIGNDFFGYGVASFANWAGDGYYAGLCWRPGARAWPKVAHADFVFG